MIASDDHTYTMQRLNFWTLYCESLHERDDENLILRLVDWENIELYQSQTMKASFYVEQH